MCLQVFKGESERLLCRVGQADTGKPGGSVLVYHQAFELTAQYVVLAHLFWQEIQFVIATINQPAFVAVDAVFVTAKQVAHLQVNNTGMWGNVELVVFQIKPYRGFLDAIKGNFGDMVQIDKEVRGNGNQRALFNTVVFHVDAAVFSDFYKHGFFDHPFVG